MHYNKYIQWIFNAAVLLLITGLFFYSNTTTKKVGYLNFDILLSKYDGIKPGEQELERNTKVLRDNIDTLTVEYNRAEKNFESFQKKMTTQERNSRRQELEKQKADLIRYREAAGAKIREEQEKTIDRFSKDIRNYLDEYSKQNNYTVVFFQKSEVIAYAEEGNDITKEVLAGLNEQYRKKKK